MMSKLHLYIIIGILLCFLSCQDENFSSSSDDVLVFSKSSVSLDTVFCEIPAQRVDFWVFNRNKKDILVSDVKLRNSEQSGFRVNVDGIYVTPSLSPRDIEVRHGDSIRVFVEMTAPHNDADKPIRIDDAIEFSLQNGPVQKVELSAYAWNADILHNPEYTENTTLNTSKPIVVYGQMKVHEGVTLTIDAGTTIYFDDKATLDVHGSLVCNGTAENQVVLRGRRLDRMFDYLPYDSISGQWKGVHIYPESFTNEMTYTDIHSAFDGILIDATTADEPTLTMKASTVHNCQGYCIKSTNAVINLENCQITNAMNDCLDIDGGVANINSCTIAQFYPFDSNRGAALRFTADKYSVAVNCSNSLITGYADDVVMGSHINESQTFDYFFKNSILRTDEVTDEHFVDVMFDKVLDVQGKDYFQLVDHKNQKFNFHLQSSPAVDAADAATAPQFDRDGKKRGDKPDIGAFEYFQ